MNFEREYVVEKLVDLVKIPSPSGFTEKAIEYIGKELLRMGFEPQYTNKGACYVCIGGEGSPVTFAAHVDTLGAMVKSLKPNCRLEITPIGGYMMNSVEGENCEIHTKNGKVYTGTIQTV
ncbi:MAG: peptidase M42, partial [Thermotogae bacterium]